MIKTKLLQFKNLILKSSILKGSFILAFGIIFCKIIGLIYRIPLTQILGVEGIGVYQLIFPIYSFLLILSSNAIPVGFSRLISLKLKKKDYKSVACVKSVGLRYFCRISIIFSLLLILCAFPLCKMQGCEKAFLGYIAIAPSIFFVCLISVYRGVFQGYNSMKQTAISQIIEQVVKLILGLFLPLCFFRFGIAFQVGASLLGITLSEIVAFCYIYVVYKKSYIQKELSNFLRPSKEEEKIILQEIKTNVSPILITNLVVPLCVMLESFIIVNILSLSNKIEIATSLYGLYSGVVCVLINAPISIISSLGMVLIPNISREKKQFKVLKKIDCSKKLIKINIKFVKPKEIVQENLKIKNVLKYSSLISLFFVLVFVIFSRIILNLIYLNIGENFLQLANILLVICSFNIFTQSITNIITSCMQAKGYFYEPIKVLCIMNFLRILLGGITLFYFGIIGYVCSNAIVFLFQLLQINKVFKCKMCKKS